MVMKEPAAQSRVSFPRFFVQTSPQTALPYPSNANHHQPTRKKASNRQQGSKVQTSTHPHPSRNADLGRPTTHVRPTQLENFAFGGCFETSSMDIFAPPLQPCSAGCSPLISERKMNFEERVLVWHLLQSEDSWACRIPSANTLPTYIHT